LIEAWSQLVYSRSTLFSPKVSAIIQKHGERNDAEQSLTLMFLVEKLNDHPLDRPEFRNISPNGRPIDNYS
jgi:hypothetical protein